ncbi:MAG: ACP S-malonyltransferase [Clostridia bacterium]|nr:ACP S-malonyltransferase [Clostridia bacterium]
MAKIAFLFSGQGAQRKGMGQDLYENNAAAKEIFDRFEKLHPGLIDLCFNGSENDLRITRNTQPAVYAVDLACAMAITQEGIFPSCAAGFSLGELAAATFVQILTPEEGFSLVEKRATFMAAASEKNPGSMLAVLRMKNEEVEALCKGKVLYPVNYNCPGQLVVAGNEDSIEELQKNIKDAGGRSIKLAVSGGFHSPFMDEAAQCFASELQQMKFHLPQIPLYSNFTGALYKEDIADLLINQINHPVQWEKIICAMDQEGVNCYIELGPGNVLSGLVSKILPQATVYNVETSEDIKRIKEEMTNAKK